MGSLIHVATAVRVRKCDGTGKIPTIWATAAAAQDSFNQAFSVITNQLMFND